MPLSDSRWLSIFALWGAAAWAMSLSTLGFFVVPMLFVHLPSPALAGNMAGQLFAVQTGISLSCSLALAAAAWRRAAVPGLWPSLTGAAMAAAAQWLATPHILARDNLPLWHGLASGMYLLQWCCAMWVFGRLAANAARQ